MSGFDTIVVGNDLVSEHWLAEQFPATVKALRAAWKEREEHGKATPRSGLLALAGTFGVDLARLRERAAMDREDLDGLRLLHASVRAALQFPGEEGIWLGERGGTELAVSAVAPGAPDGPPLLILQAQDAGTVEDLLDTEGKGQLLTPAQLGTTTITATATAISEVFQSEEPPALVVVTAGAWLLLAERGSWPEGRWLAVDLSTVCDRRDTRAAGELETAAALMSADSLMPADDGSTLLLSLLEESVKHAVGVSQDLRDGIRESIELLATDVLRRRREKGLPDDAPDLARDLTRQCLRYLYRILFLLYAEARPELGVLPAGAPEYSEGYGLDRLRELVLTELTTESAENGRHFYESLATLFRLVNEGYPPETLDGAGTRSVGEVPTDDGGELRFEALRADLFSDDAVALVDEVGLGNRCLQQVLSRLLLSKKQKGRDRGFVSYAQLGINQLGAVYEGLMSYTGSIATVPSIEVAKDGDRTKGSWVVPQSATEGFDESWFVKVTDPETGLLRRITYAPGDFVFRLSGYDRQRSASYYTPESLTRLVVDHSLAELLDQGGRTTPAADILSLTVCEPALGSGAFLVEAVRQLADQYLRRRQAELGTRIPAEEYPAELQRAKAHIALHQVYGVDLNATAVELAEITLWLDAMHPGLRAPWFGLHLRRGNSLIGARREMYAPKELDKRAWLTTVPTARPLGTPVEAGEVHHFLLPAAGWGAVADTKEAKELAPDARARLADWRKKVTAALSKDEQRRLSALAQRVEVLWGLALRRLEIAEAEARRHISVWGAEDLPAGTGAVQREQIEEVLTDPDGAYQRLHRVMDAWAALWSWPVTTDMAPPTREQWLGALEMLLGTVSKAEARAGRGMFADVATWDDLDVAEHDDRAWSQARPVARVLDEHPWLGVCEHIGRREGYFHWELAFGPVFARGGGFDLQLGNPPWVRPFWDDSLTLAEADPWFGLADKPSVAAVRQRRDAVLEKGAGDYLDARAATAGLSEHLGSNVDRPILAGLNPDLYRCFMDRSWRSMSPAGVVGLIHPESHFTEARAGGLRRQTYRHLRRHWQFANNMYVFREISDKTSFGVHVYGADRAPAFLNASSIFQPGTVERSLMHDGSGAEPGVRDDEDNWDTRPHRSRIVRVDEVVLANWAGLIDEPGTAPAEARMLRPVNTASQIVLDKLARAPRFGEIRFHWTRGWEEDADRKAGYFHGQSAVPSSWDDVILQGPHLTVANPFARQPNENARNRQDTTAWDLEALADRAIPRTNYQRAKTPEQYFAGYSRWDGKPSNEFFRLAWRDMADSFTVRTLHAAVLPPGPTHVGGIFSAGNMSVHDLAVAAGMWASIPVDFLAKVSGKGHMKVDFTSRFPHPREHLLVPELLLRALRLNCLTADYTPLWEQLFDAAWQQDAWSRQLPAAPLGDVEKQWTMATPLRRDAERRQALVEIDALAAVMLGITAEELCAIYRTQFGVLRKYERVMQMDANGRQVPAEVLKEYAKKGDRADLGRYELPFTGVDREAEMTTAHAEFSRRLADR
ncbi:DNA methyltransferase [Blastococcus sp. VKM Ac-2987]|uniref:DNA methyltransferase n=1 Tax=Blastococcus sp. VKM Ac-2987 TaxID=3004141 RepID=UPI0022ABC3BB|nr:DNA methyltransferase [Blastococcus sp. VKM Ac-2987]MCZ2859985.1 N-6 DNA methylase [Blastococcus sp. VKM Ac-2987]